MLIANYGGSLAWVLERDLLSPRRRASREGNGCGSGRGQEDHREFSVGMRVEVAWQPVLFLWGKTQWSSRLRMAFGSRFLWMAAKFTGPGIRGTAAARMACIVDPSSAKTRWNPPRGILQNNDLVDMVAYVRWARRVLVWGQTDTASFNARDGITAWIGHGVRPQVTEHVLDQHQDGVIDEDSTSQGRRSHRVRRWFVCFPTVRGFCELLSRLPHRASDQWLLR
ncbi:MAG: hypothetical protein FWD57_07590 [Polyangiaceae bacterium]|nr:hypothetical protein [Polyangiaceae bacterium]